MVIGDALYLEVWSCYETNLWTTVEMSFVLKCVLGLGWIPGGEASIYTAPLLPIIVLLAGPLLDIWKIKCLSGDLCLKCAVKPLLLLSQNGSNSFKYC